ncbi:MAG: magnesium transporter [Alphaproteobacteria bacterium]
MNDQPQDIETEEDLSATMIDLMAGDVERDGAEVRQIEVWLDAREDEALSRFVDAAAPADIAWVLSQTDGDHRAELIHFIADEFDPQILAYLSAEALRDTVHRLPNPRLAVAMAELESDDLLEIVEDLPEDQQSEVLRLVSTRLRAQLEEGLAFPEDSAGRLMQREVVSLPPFWTVGEAIDYFRAVGDKLPQTFLDIFLVDPILRVEGVVHLHDMLKAPRKTRLRDIADTEIMPIPADRDQEEVAIDFTRYGLKSAPVVDVNDRLIGMITIDDVVDVIGEEASEDALALAGAQEGDLYESATHIARRRFVWLLINLCTAVLASLVIGMFEATLEQLVALAVLMPIVASMGGNAGTQTLTVAVRGLATRELSSANAFRVVGRETGAGLLNGIAFALLIGVVASVWFSSVKLGVVIAVAMVVNMGIAAMSGVLIPVIFHRMKIDPAVSSTVFLTTVTDVVGFYAFLGLASLWLL